MRPRDKLSRLLPVRRGPPANRVGGVGQLTDADPIAAIKGLCREVKIEGRQSLVVKPGYSLRERRNCLGSREE
jgi:hypothetical protein